MCCVWQKCLMKLKTENSCLVLQSLVCGSGVRLVSGFRQVRFCALNS